jgi:hypothetical protein
MSSLTSLSSSSDEENSLELHNRGEGGSIPTALAALGRRKRRRRNQKKESDRRAKRQKVNPRRRGGSKRERVDRGKRSQAEKRAVESSVCSRTLKKSKKVEPKQIIFDLEGIKHKKIRVVSWDGM